MVTMTFSVSRSSLTSSTTPLKLANGPSVMRTDSLFWNLTLSRGFSLEVSLRKRIELTSPSVSATGLSPVPRNPVTRGVFLMTCQIHFDEDVAGEEDALHGALFAVDDLGDGFRGNHDAADAVLEAESLDAGFNRLAHFALEARVGMDDVPPEAVVGGRFEVRLVAACAVDVRVRGRVLKFFRHESHSFLLQHA
jgi:hypothetical protein